MKYILNKKLFSQRLQERGFSSLSDFAAQAKIHRNTLRRYVEGKNSVFSSSYEEIAQALQADPAELMIKLNANVGDSIAFEELKKGLQAISKDHPEVTFFLFGSRGEGKHREFSDWDIGVTGGPFKITGREYLTLKAKVDDFFEDFPYCVDLVNMDQAPRWFLHNLKGESLHFLCGNREHYQYVLGVLYATQTFQEAS